MPRALFLNFYRYHCDAYRIRFQPLTIPHILLRTQLLLYHFPQLVQVLQTRDALLAQGEEFRTRTGALIFSIHHPNGSIPIRLSD